MNLITYFTYLYFTGITIGGALISDSQLVINSPTLSQVIEYQKQSLIIQEVRKTLDSDEIFELTNVERIKHNLLPLKRDPALDRSARMKTQDMFENKYWEHVSPDGKQPWDFMKAEGFTYRFAGENLAKDLLHSGDVVRSWMESPVHRENILNPNFTHMGVYISVLEINGGNFWSVVQHLASGDVDEVIPE